MIGTRLHGRYRLEEQLGSGGMSTVYRAFDETLERWVAIKLMHSEFSHDADQLERFRREARSIAALSHPHVVTVIDAGEDDGHPHERYDPSHAAEDHGTRSRRRPCPRPRLLRLPCVRHGPIPSVVYVSITDERIAASVAPLSSMR